MSKQKRAGGGKVDKFLNITILVQVVFIAVYCALTFAPRKDAAEREQVTVEQLAVAARGIKTYSAELNTTVRFWFVPGFEELARRDQFDPRIRSKLLIASETGKRTRVDLTISAADEEMAFVVVYDGVWQWLVVEGHGKKCARKVRVDRLPSSMRNREFGSRVWIGGAGLCEGEALPGSALELLSTYDLTLLPASDKRARPDEWVFAGKLKKDEAETLAQGAVDGSPDAELGRMLGESFLEGVETGLFRFSKKNLLLVGYQLGPPDEDPSVVVDITYRSVNERLPRGTFEFTPSPGVEVKDLTDEFIAQANSNR